MLSDDRRRLAGTLALWLLATALATAVSAIGVSVVTSRVADANAIAVNGSGPQHAAVTAVATTSAPQPTDQPTTTTAATATTVAASPAVGPVATAAPDSSAVTFTAPGGVVVVTCQGDAIALISARPTDGYRMEIKDAGPSRVEVEFSSSRDQSRIEAVCVGGVPTRIDQQDNPATTFAPTTTAPRGGDGGGDGSGSTSSGSDGSGGPGPG